MNAYADIIMGRSMQQPSTHDCADQPDLKIYAIGSVIESAKITGNLDEVVYETWQCVTCGKFWWLMEADFSLGYEQSTGTFFDPGEWGGGVAEIYGRSTS